MRRLRVLFSELCFDGVQTVGAGFSSVFGSAALSALGLLASLVADAVGAASYHGLSAQPASANAAADIAAVRARFALRLIVGS